MQPAQSAWLQSEIHRLFSLGALEPAQSAQYVTRAFLTPKPGRTDAWRLVVDLRHVNSFLRKQSTRLETLKRLRTLARKDDWMFSIDLQDGFYALGVHPDDRKYLTLDIAGVGMVQFSALPMGLSSSPYAFCKLMRSFTQALRAPLATMAAKTVVPLATVPTGRHVHTQRRNSNSNSISRWAAHRQQRLHRHFSKLAGTASRAAPGLSSLIPRFRHLMQRGLRVLPYMDDFLFLCSSLSEALEARAYVEAVLALLGLRRNAKKGIWEPSQVVEHLGLGVDTEKGIFYVTPTRLHKLHTAAKALLCRAGNSRTNGVVPRRQLAGFTGLAQSLYLAVPPARLYLRRLHDCVASGGKNWAGGVRLSSGARSDLQWFADLQDRYNGRKIWRSPHTALLHCDASELAWGSVLNLKVPARGFWRAHQRREHITLLEARAVRYGVETFLEALAGRHVLLREDNQAVCAMLRSWTSRSPALLRELRKLWWLLDDNNIVLSPKYIRSADNWFADHLSRQSDDGDWRLNPRCFRLLQRAWGPHTVDRFATANNTQLPRFNSAWADPRSEGLDAFAQHNWGEENNYCNPPWDLLDRLAQLLHETPSAGATVVAPHWPAQPWFQQLQEMACDTLLFPAAPDLFCPGRLGSSVFIGPPRWSVICFRIAARR